MMPLSNTCLFLVGYSLAVIRYATPALGMNYHTLKCRELPLDDWPCDQHTLCATSGAAPPDPASPRLTVPPYPLRRRRYCAAWPNESSSDRPTVPAAPPQVLRRLAAWLDSEQDQRQQQRQHLDSIREQMDKMALELERIETKMDLKMDRQQEVSVAPSPATGARSIPLATVHRPPSTATIKPALNSLIQKYDWHSIMCFCLLLR